MATREENLKKINSELEKLSDEQLDNVAGGMIPPKGGMKTVPDTTNSPNEAEKPSNSIFSRILSLLNE